MNEETIKLLMAPLKEDGSIKLIPVEYGFQKSVKFMATIKGDGFIPASNSGPAGPFGKTGANYIPADARPLGSIGKSFIPCDAMPDAARNAAGSPRKTYEEKALDWWSPNALFHYDSMLVSAYYGKDIPNYREHYKIPRKGFTLYGDSGGFQNATNSQRQMGLAGFNKPLNPVNVLKWQEDNCDVGFVLDWPIAPNTPDNIVELHRTRTIENAEFALTKWQNKDMRLYATIHGRTAEELKTMVKQSGDLGRFSGIALGSIVPMKSDVMYIANTMMNFAELIQDYKLPIHIFGLSGVNSLPVVLYVAKKYNLKVTFDSASYGVGAQHRQFWNPLNLSMNSLTYGNDPKTSIVPEHLPCDCPVCETVGDDLLQMIREGKNNSVVGSLICLHNLYVFNRFVKMLTAYAEKDELLKSLVKNVCKDKTTTALEFIDFSLENSIEAGYQKYMVEGFDSTKSTEFIPRKVAPAAPTRTVAPTIVEENLDPFNF